jgi:surface polysaccharide O-acyltransferase-like enzyme
VGTGIVTLLTLYSSIGPQAAWFRDVVFLLTGTIGYFILGAYVSKLHFRKSILAVGLISSSFFTIVGTYLITSNLGEAYSQFFLTANSFSVLIASITLFLLMAAVPNQTIEAKFPRGNKVLSIISQNTLPIFLFHMIVLEALQNGYLGFRISLTSMNPIVEIPLVTAVTLLICLAIIVPLKKIPYVGRIIG